MTARLRVALLGGMAAESAALLERATSAEVSIVSDTTFTSPSARAAVDGADAVISPRFPLELADVADTVRMVHSTGAGVDLIDVHAVPSGVPICNCQGHARAMAEYAIGAMISVSRNLGAADRRLRDGDWRYGASFGPPQGIELRGRHVVVVGSGEAVKDLVPMLSALGMTVSISTRSPERAAQVLPDAATTVGLNELRTLLPAADYLVLAVPLTSQTEGLLGAREFAVMKPSAILVNMARSRVADEAALYAALVEGRIGGAALDVWTRRPETNEARSSPSPHDFSLLDSVLMTPHLAGWTRESQQNRWLNIAANIDRLAAGEPVLNIVARGQRGSDAPPPA